VSAMNFATVLSLCLSLSQNLVSKLSFSQNLVFKPNFGKVFQLSPNFVSKPNFGKRERKRKRKENGTNLFFWDLSVTIEFGQGNWKENAGEAIEKIERPAQNTCDPKSL
jgi:hypothetical protein